MMHIDRNEEDEITTINCSDTIKPDELKNFIAEVFMGEITRFIIWDFSKADLSQLTKEVIRDIAFHAKAIVHSRSNGKTALIANDTESLKKGEFFSAFVEYADHLAKTKVFLNKEEALKWINQS